MTGISLSRSVTSPRASGCPSPWPLQATPSRSIMAMPAGLTRLPCRGRHHRHSRRWRRIHLPSSEVAVFSVCHALPLVIIQWRLLLAVSRRDGTCQLEYCIVPSVSYPPGGRRASALGVRADSSSTGGTFPGFQATVTFPLLPHHQYLTHMLLSFH